MPLDDMCQIFDEVGSLWKPLCISHLIPTMELQFQIICFEKNYLALAFLPLLKYNHPRVTMSNLQELMIDERFQIFIRLEK